MKYTLVWPVYLETNVYIFFWYFITLFLRTTTNSKRRIFFIVLVDHKFKILVTGHFLLKNLENKKINILFLLHQAHCDHYVQHVFLHIGLCDFLSWIGIFFYNFFYSIIFLLYQAHCDHYVQHVSLHIGLCDILSWIGIFFFNFFYPIIFLLYQAHYDHDAQLILYSYYNIPTIDNIPDNIPIISSSLWSW